MNILSQFSSVIVEPTDVVNIEPPKNNLLDFLKDTEYDYLFAEQTDKTAKDLKNRFKMFKDEEAEVYYIWLICLYNYSQIIFYYLYTYVNLFFPNLFTIRRLNQMMLIKLELRET